jgi:hypothetical protein
MAYVPDNLSLKVPAPGAGVQFWHLSGVDAIATVRAANFISNARAAGMRVGDILFYSDTATPLQSMSRVTAVTATGATLSA